MMREMDFIDECYADKDLSLLKKLTLVIPTYNRNYYLSRCLWYHAHFPFGEIIVADSSPEKKKAVNRETIQKTREVFGANIRYLEYEPETEKYGGDIYRKWGDAVQHVETEYSVNCADKEFIIPTTLGRAIDFLDENPDYIIAEGEDYLMEVYSKKKIGFYPWQGVESFDADTVEKRLIAYLDYKGIAGIQYGVGRSECMKQIYANLIHYQILDIRFGETAIELQPLIFGKTKRFPNLPSNCRDVTHLKRGCLFITKKERTESSFTRYPYLEEYPRERMQEMARNTAECFLDMWHRKGEKMIGYPKNVEEMIQYYVTPLMEKRYTSYKLKKNMLKKVISSPYLWDKIPIRWKEFLSKTWGQGSISRKIQTEEMKCILRTHQEMDQCHTGDVPIYYLLKKQLRTDIVE